jgi:hypothetical protein
VIEAGKKAERKLAVPSTLPAGEFRLREEVLPGTSLPKRELFSQPFSIVPAR